MKAALVDFRSVIFETSSKSIEEMKEEKTQVNDINREFYDFRYEEKDVYQVDSGLTADIVREISKDRNDPEWMLQFRLESLKKYNSIEVPDWGPDISGLDMDHIITYIRPNAQRMQSDWKEVPTDIKDTFERLGIPKAERESLAGV